MARQSKITALVPCYNEGERIRIVLQALVKSRLINEVIVVDANSTDNSQAVIKSFPQVKLLNLTASAGKGNSLAQAVHLVKTPFTFLCDADIHGLTDTQIGKMVTAVTGENYDVCVGVRYRWGRFGQWLRRNIFPLIAGERIIRTGILKEVLQSPIAAGWGLELYMNDYVRRQHLKMKKVDLVGVDDVFNMKKRGVFSYFRRYLIFISIYWQLLVLNIDQLLVIAAICLRLVFGALIFWAVWPAVVVNLFTDWVDGELYKRAGFTKIRYQFYDKILDYYWFVMIIIYLLTTHARSFPFFLLLFLVRTLGHVGFMLTKKVIYFFFFPNVFEVFFYFYLLTGTLPNWFWLIVMVFGVLIREYILHIAKLNLSWIFMGKTTHWIDEKH